MLVCQGFTEALFCGIGIGGSDKAMDLLYTRGGTKDVEDPDAECTCDSGEEDNLALASGAMCRKGGITACQVCWRSCGVFLRRLGGYISFNQRVILIQCALRDFWVAFRSLNARRNKLDEHTILQYALCEAIQDIHLPYQPFRFHGSTRL